MRTLIRFIVALSALFALSAPIAATAATGPDVGFMTLMNPTTGEQVLFVCEGGRITYAAVLRDGEEHAAGAPIGAMCSAGILPGFMQVFNLDPRGGGWFISPYTQDGTIMALGCSDEGVTFIIKNPGQAPYEYTDRKGTCSPGSIPG